MNKQYFKEYYDLERNHWWFLVRLKILKSVIAKYMVSSGPLRILNVGVATGATSEMLKHFGDVVSIEYDKDCCEFLNANTDIHVIQGSILDLQQKDSSFDLVCCFDVIEHVDNDNKALHELFRVCRPTGYVFVTVPAFSFLWSHHDIVNQHYRRYTLKSFKRLLDKISSEIIYRTYFNTLLFIPIAMFRLFHNTVQFRKTEKSHKDSGSDFGMITNKYLNRILLEIFSVEQYLIQCGAMFPFGVSLLLFLRKK